jgi:hypothetical protein
MAHQLWLPAPEEHDYPAAAAYLSLLLGDQEVSQLVAHLRHALPAQYKAKDLLRASRLPLLDRDNAHVAKDLRKIHDGTALSPVLVIRGDLHVDRPLCVADGYHRICASYWIDENTDIPVYIADLEDSVLG